MRKEGGATSTQGITSAPPIVSEVLKCDRDHVMDTARRAFMESSLGYSFGDVKIHTGSRAAEWARRVNALTYIIGRDIVFGAGQYAPATMAGRTVAGACYSTRDTWREQKRISAETPTTVNYAIRAAWGLRGLMERDLRPRQKTSEEERAKSIPEEIQGGWLRIGKLDGATLRTANITQRIEMPTQLIKAYWTGNQEEEAINNIIFTTPLSQSAEFLKLLSEEKINGNPF